MCYSAQAWQDYRKFRREFDATLGIDEYIRLFWNWKTQGSPVRLTKAMLDAFADAEAGQERRIAGWIGDWKARQASAIEQELFALRKRLADAERRLQARPTRKAQEDARIASDKIARARLRLSDLGRTTPEPRDARFFPGYHATVMVSEGGHRVLYPMRYGCRPAGKPANYDTRYPGTYNARRDNLEGFWRGQFGHTHALMVVETFFENVADAHGHNRILQFRPRDGGPMYVACLWSRWTDPAGQQPELLSFAAITDAPEPEVRAAGHDRTIINIRPEHIDAWLNPDPGNLPALQAILDDKQHPYYEHQQAA